MNQIRTFFVVICISFLAGCAEFRTVTEQDWPSESAGLTPELALLYREVAISSSALHSLDGYADIWIKTPRRQERVYSNIQLKRSEDMRIIISAGILGWPVADMLFRTDSLFVHDMLNNRLLVGRNTPDNMEKILGMRSGYEFLSDALFGVVRLQEPLRAIESVKTGAGKVSYTIRTASGKQEVLVDPLTKTIEALQVYDRSERLVIEMHFRRFMTSRVAGASVTLPREIELALYDQRLEGNGAHEMVIVYDERQLNPEGFTIRYRVPEKARVVNLDRVGILPWM
ncbi:MAG: DUF4292 domain-containing protein [Prosthecochloris sp.]|uniref:DUF4292 domain-containing protein n=1 Tax=Prosthecochloris aestuarii (strain DSM 271 / SK 413) TaxID=290512 RepID=B4S838_PROA2|nr:MULTISPECIES: DUF4292 domain-containing protein [Prosthecochloris]ACF46225.1 conserved hypothetical protein [Prosthecochloris aestuarii DSM 271]MCW8799125.1 DUF4292 domain-containing protein [Prosthecochloris sp.]